MKLHRMAFLGFHGVVTWAFIETEKSIIFAAGAELFWMYVCRLSNLQELDESVRKAISHTVADVDDSDLETMIDEWATTGDRWRADLLRENMKEKIMEYVEGRKKASP